jgi:hypothetical protein
MKIKVGGHRPHPQNGTLKHKGTQPRPNPVHAGSGRPHGILHEAPTRPMVNDQNYAGHKIGRRRSSK